MAARDKDQAVAVPRTADRALAEYPGMVTSVPEAEFDPDGSGIIADILLATSWEQLNESQTSLPDSRSLNGRTVFVTGIGRMTSDMEGGIGYYLIVDYADPATGEARKFQTSAGSVMAKLVKLHHFVQAGAIAWPVEVKLVQATKPTRGGFYPMDLEVVSTSKPQVAATGTDGPGY